MHFHGASSAESITGNLFRKISVQEFTKPPPGVNGKEEFETNRIVSIFQALSFKHFTLILFRRNVELPALESLSVPVSNMM